MAGWLGARWPRSARLPRYLRLATTLENIGRDPAAAYFADLCFLKPRDVSALVGANASSSGAAADALFEAVTEPYRRCPSPDPVQRAQYADLKIYLPNDVLVKVDRMSMAHSLEVRCPLLDRRIVELAFRLPFARKLPGLEAKRLLKQVAARRLPPALLKLPKRGFTAPVGSWMTGLYARRYQDEVFGRDSAVASWMDIALLRRWFDEHRAGTANRSYVLWAVWCLERWARLQTQPVTGTRAAGADSQPARPIAV
jgi:asparagine synthase (glutamine-hydrolysing)